MKTKEKIEKEEKKKRLVSLPPEKAIQGKTSLWEGVVAELKSKKFLDEEAMIEAVITAVISRGVSNEKEEVREFLRLSLTTDPHVMEILKKELL